MREDGESFQIYSPRSSSQKLTFSSTRTRTRQTSNSKSRSNSREVTPRRLKARASALNQMRKAATSTGIDTTRAIRSKRIVIPGGTFSLSVSSFSSQKSLTASTSSRCVCSFSPRSRRTSLNSWRRSSLPW